MFAFESDYDRGSVVLRPPNEVEQANTDNFRNDSGKLIHQDALVQN